MIRTTGQHTTNLCLPVRFRGCRRRRVRESAAAQSESCGARPQARLPRPAHRKADPINQSINQSSKQASSSLIHSHQCNSGERILPIVQICTSLANCSTADDQGLSQTNHLVIATCDRPCSSLSGMHCTQSRLQVLVRLTCIRFSQCCISASRLYSQGACILLHFDTMYTQFRCTRLSS